MQIKKLAPVSKTINRTLKTAKLFDAFWERWLVHGVDIRDLNSVRMELQSVEQWYHSWELLAEKKEQKARKLQIKGLFKEAEYVYRQSALYYNLNYWIDPQQTLTKQLWYNKCLQITRMADSLSKIETLYKTIQIDDSQCAGRIRIPNNPKGTILIINPIDSSKEELFKYEMEFVSEGFITVSFDGPGQGETFIQNKVIGTRKKWEQFINRLIEFTNESFPGFPIYLFGTSLGASWVLYGSSHKKVTKAVAVSPAVELEIMNMPTYFMERIDCSCNLDTIGIPIPNYKNLKYNAPVLLVHGNQDMMVSTSEMYKLYQKIPVEKFLLQYEDEGHCCNNKLGEIRKLSLSWFTGKFKPKRGLL
jgi:predicted esterase